MISLYFHIPFCTKKCPYCHFYVIPNTPSSHRLLEEGISLEWERQIPLLRGKTIVSIYFGGGTPTLFAPLGIQQILQKIRESEVFLSPSCEITVEANPEDGSRALFESLIALGVNRLSMGVQSLDDRSLGTLERIHSAEKAKRAIYMASEVGFKNISIDLMYDLPSQTEAGWDYTLRELPSLPIQHLSLYNLTIEPHTSFYRRKNSLSFPPPEVSLRFLTSAVHALETMGFARYEISAFAKLGFQSMHNLGYWTGRSFLGFGPSAFSFWEGKRFRNMANLNRYTKALKEGNQAVDFQETLPFPQNIQELLAVRLRLLEGADIDPRFPPDLQSTIQKLIDNNFLRIKDSKIQLTEQGILFHDTVASEII